jgi:hypothetical protein
MTKVAELFLSKLSKPRWQFFILLAFTLLIHSPLLVVRQSENPDAGYIFPLLRSLSFPVGYLHSLINLDTLDFQPIRDLTLYLDIFIYDQTGFSLAVIFNCLIWAGACFQILRIIEAEISRVSDWRFFLLILAFSVYPIFYNTVNWGIARKHLLAFFFILTATRNLNDWVAKRKGILSVVLPFTLSTLSLPIAVGWPFWTMLRLGPRNILAERRSRALMISLLVIMLLIVGINWAYYKTSLSFLEIYPQKAKQFDILFILINLGLQIKQMIFPYQLGFFYNFKGAHFGLGFFLVFLVTVYFKLRKKPNVWIWILFGLVPMAVTLSTPNVYYDPYVIIPLAGAFLFSVTQFPDLLHRYALFTLPFLVFWSVLTWQGNFVWGNLVRFYEASFATNPNCSNAIMYGSRLYRSGQKMTNELYEFIQVNECFMPEAFQSLAMTQKKMNFEALMLYKEDEIDKEYREQRLRELGRKSFYPLILYAAFLSQEDEAQEVESIMGDLNLLTDSQLRIEYDPVVLEVLPAFCEKNELYQCLQFMKKWKKKNIPVSYF